MHSYIWSLTEKFWGDFLGAKLATILTPVMSSKTVSYWLYTMMVLPNTKVPLNFFVM
jgi:hypothetical protein